MPYQVQQIIKGKSAPVCVSKDDSVSQALSIMIEHDFSQLPVVHQEDNFIIPDGLITYESIIRGIRNFKANIEDLKVRNVMVTAPIYSEEEDLFDILDRLKDTNAVLVRSEDSNDLAAIVTSYDASEYFRKRTEDLMRVEDIEVMVKDFIKAAYANENGDLNEDKLQTAINLVTSSVTKDLPSGEKAKTFNELTLAEYISLLLKSDTWPFLAPVFGVPREHIRELLNGIREIRNGLAHFRLDISADERDKLKFGTEWMAKCQEAYQEIQRERLIQKAINQYNQNETLVTVNPPLEEPEIVLDVGEVTGTETSMKGGRYAALADWLQNQPGRVDQVQLTFNQIEEIIKTDLPASARNHRAWWANDSVSHNQSQLWLDAGWRSSFVNLTEGRVTFNRIAEREKAYIAFFSSLLDELRKKAEFPIRQVNPDGASWIGVSMITCGGRAYAWFNYSFSRDWRFRAELYLDLPDQQMTKAVFDKLLAQKDKIEAQLGGVTWERLDDRNASRIVKYHEGHISEINKHAELRNWAVAAMTKLNQVLREPAEKAISEVIQG